MVKSLNPKSESELPKGHWNKEAVCENAKMYSSRTEWMKASSSAYSIAHKKGWLEMACRHMMPKLDGIWIS